MELEHFCGYLVTDFGVWRVGSWIGVDVEGVFLSNATEESDSLGEDQRRIFNQTRRHKTVMKVFGVGDLLLRESPVELGSDYLWSYTWFVD